MDSPLEGIAFLARSENRVAVLQAFATDDWTRQELRADLDVSRTTLARILNEFETRRLIARTGQGYTATPTAEAIHERFVPLLETMEGLATLGEAIEWLPEPARAIDVRHLRDAEITTTSNQNPSAPFDHGLASVRDADTYRGLTSTAIPQYVETVSERTAAGDLDGEGVIQASFLDVLADAPERVEPWYDIADRLFLYDGQVPVNMHIVDETVLIWLGEFADGELEIHGLLESTNPAVLSWAEACYAEYRDAADPLDPARLPDPE